MKRKDDFIVLISYKTERKLASRMAVHIGVKSVLKRIKVSVKLYFRGEVCRRITMQLSLFGSMQYVAALFGSRFNLEHGFLVVFNPSNSENHCKPSA